jgi:hypothetical protein
VKKAYGRGRVTRYFRAVASARKVPWWVSEVKRWEWKIVALR